MSARTQETTGKQRVSAERLITSLERSHALYTELLGLIRARRAAIRCADFGRFSQLGSKETRIVAELAQLDEARLAEVQALAVRLALPPAATLGDIALCLGEPQRARIDALRSELRPLVEDVRRESGVVRQAAERLSAHMAGILQSVHSALAHANVYSRGGRIADGTNVISSLDIRS